MSSVVEVPASYMQGVTHAIALRLLETQPELRLRAGDAVVFDLAPGDYVPEIGEIVLAHIDGETDIRKWMGAGDLRGRCVYISCMPLLDPPGE